MTETDEELLKWYMKGFIDELYYGTSSTVSDISLENKAYQLGAQHAIIGDDVSGVDLLTNEEILKLIRMKTEQIAEYDNHSNGSGFDEAL